MDKKLSKWPSWVSPLSKKLNIEMKRKLKLFEIRHGSIFVSEYAMLIDRLIKEEFETN